MRAIVREETTANVTRLFRRQRTASQSQCYVPCSFLIELLVESFVASTHYVSQNAERLRATSDLPRPLERIALIVQKSPRAWLAWQDEQTTRFVVAAMAERCIQHSLAAIRLAFYDEDGRQVAMGEWSRQQDGCWLFCGH